MEEVLNGGSNMTFQGRGTGKSPWNTFRKDKLINQAWRHSGMRGQAARHIRIALLKKTTDSACIRHLFQSEPGFAAACGHSAYAIDRCHFAARQEGTRNKLLPYRYS